MMRGLTIDKVRGNVLKVDRYESSGSDQLLYRSAVAEYAHRRSDTSMSRSLSMDSRR